MGISNFSISPDAFKDTSLEYIIIENCGLENFPDVGYIGSILRKLKLPFNYIKDIPMRIISKLTVLEYLDLAGNQLSGFPDLSPLAGSLIKLGLSG